MTTSGYAVYVTDGTWKNLPAAVFAFGDDANKWAGENYPGRYYVKLIRWSVTDGQETP